MRVLSGLLAMVLFGGCAFEGGTVSTGSGSDTDSGDDGSGNTGGDDGSGSDTATPAAPFLDGFFPIAADFQPPSAFDKWKTRGINTMIRVPGGTSVKDWSAAAKSHGFKMIREPANNPADDVGDQDLLAWHWMDEPELHGATATDAAEFRAQMHAIDPSRPLAVNHWGGGMRLANSAGCYNGHCYPDYIDKMDWTSDDIYPVNKFDGNLRVVGEEVSQLRTWATKGQPAFAYIETGDWDGNGSGPSPKQFAAEIWDAVIHGARGIYYFSARIQVPCSSNCLLGYDMTTTDVVDEMKHTNARLTALAPILQRAINPSTASMTGPDGLEIGWRHDPIEHAYYFFVLNPVDALKTGKQLTVHGVQADQPIAVVDEGRTTTADTSGVIVDNFQPFEVHIYKVLEPAN